MPAAKRGCLRSFILMTDLTFEIEPKSIQIEILVNTNTNNTNLIQISPPNNNVFIKQ